MPTPSVIQDERAQREQAAWDEGQVWAENRKQFNRFRHVFECPHSTAIERSQLEKLFRFANGKRVLEIGCYEGGMAEKVLGTVPCEYVGIDISPVAVEKANKLNLSARFQVADAAATGLPGASFDLVFGSAVLHHLPWEQSISEIKRLLRPGGVAIFQEPLLDNPISKLYRRLTPKARTPDELPISAQQIRWANAQFPGNDHRYSPFLSMYCGALTSFLPVGPDNFLLRQTATIDMMLEKTPLKYWMRCGYFTWIE